MCKINLKKIERQASEAQKSFQPYPYPVHQLDLNNVSGMPSLEELNAKLLATSSSAPNFYSGSPFEEPYLSTDGFSLIDLGISASNPFLSSLEDLGAMSSLPISTESLPSTSYYPMMPTVAAATATPITQPQFETQFEPQLQPQFTSFSMDVPYHTLPPTSPEQAAMTAPSLSSSPILESQMVSPMPLPLDPIKVNPFSSCGEEEEDPEEPEEERSCSPSSPVVIKGLASSLALNPVTFHQVDVTANKKKAGITQSTTVDKRERNRLAAEKYRKKGREMISTLEKKCQDLIKENGNLMNRNKGLEEEIAYLHQILSRSGVLSHGQAPSAQVAGSQTSSAFVF